MVGTALVGECIYEVACLNRVNPSTVRLSGVERNPLVPSVDGVVVTSDAAVLIFTNGVLKLTDDIHSDGHVRSCLVHSAVMSSSIRSDRTNKKRRGCHWPDQHSYH